MSDRFVDSGILVVYEKGEQFFHGKPAALAFAASMEARGYMCEFYNAWLEGGKVTRRRWVSADKLRMRSSS